MIGIGLGIRVGKGASGAVAPNGNPSALVATVVSDTRIDLSWTNGATNHDGTEVFISTDGVSYISKGTTIGNGTTFSAQSLITGTLYYFKVAHYNGNTHSGFSNVDINIPSEDNAPTSIVLTPLEGGINITWNDVEGTEGPVHIFCSIDGNTYSEIAEVNVGVEEYFHSITGDHILLYRLLQDIVPISFEQEYQSILAEMTTLPTTEVQAQQNNIVKGLKDVSLWSKLDGFWMFAGHTNDASESLINWKNPSSDKATLINAPTFTANRGFTGATSKGIDLKWGPVDNGVNYTLNNAAVLLGIYNTGSQGYLFGGQHWQSSYTAMGYACKGYVNSTASQQGTEVLTGGKCYISLIRKSATVFNQAVNKNAGTDYNVNAMSALYPKDFYALTFSDNGSVGTSGNGTLSFLCLGNFTESEKNQIIDIVEVYMDYINNSIL